MIQCSDIHVTCTVFVCLCVSVCLSSELNRRCIKYYRALTVSGELSMLLSGAQEPFCIGSLLGLIFSVYKMSSFSCVSPPSYIPFSLSLIHSASLSKALLIFTWQELMKHFSFDSAWRICNTLGVMCLLTIKLSCLWLHPCLRFKTLPST